MILMFGCIQVAALRSAAKTTVTLGVVSALTVSITALMLLGLYVSAVWVAAVTAILMALGALAIELPRSRHVQAFFMTGAPQATLLMLGVIALAFLKAASDWPLVWP